MTFHLTSDSQVYCWLKYCLEPAFRVVALPDSSYFQEQQYHYEIWNQDERLFQLRGDFRQLEPGALMSAAADVVDALCRDSLQTGWRIVRDHSPTPHVAHTGLAASEPPVMNAGVSAEDRQLRSPDGRAVIASRLLPLHAQRTWFSSGRAAYAWAVEQVVRPQRIWLPAYCCWSLIDVTQRRFPQIPLLFYPVDRQLNCQFPELTSGDLLVWIRYFGHTPTTPPASGAGILMDDVSHVLIPDAAGASGIQFGSLRKVLRVADGGFLAGYHQPVYEPDCNLPAWLRQKSTDWKDLREAENMLDRNTVISDMSSQSMAVVANVAPELLAAGRRRNEQILRTDFPVGRPLIEFAADEVPLLYNVVLDSAQQRDSLRSYLAQSGIFCSVHWPVHPLVRQQSMADALPAVWLEEHLLSIPLADFTEQHMAMICQVASDWRSKEALRRNS